MGYKDLGNNWNRKWLDDIKAMLKELFSGVEEAKNNPQIKDNTISNEQLKEKTIRNARIADGAIDDRTLYSGAVSTPKIQNEAVTTAKIKNNNVTNEKISDGAITNNKLAKDSILKTNIKNREIVHEKIDYEAIETSNLKNDSVTYDKQNIFKINPSKIESKIMNIWADDSSNKILAGTNYYSHVAELKQNKAYKLEVSGSLNRLRVSLTNSLEASSECHFIFNYSGAISSLDDVTKIYIDSLEYKYVVVSYFIADGTTNHKNGKLEIIELDNNAFQKYTIGESNVLPLSKNHWWNYEGKYWDLSSSNKRGVIIPIKPNTQIDIEILGQHDRFVVGYCTSINSSNSKVTTLITETGLKEKSEYNAFNKDNQFLYIGFSSGTYLPQKINVIQTANYVEKLDIDFDSINTINNSIFSANELKEPIVKDESNWIIKNATVQTMDSVTTLKSNVGESFLNQNFTRKKDDLFYYAVVVESNSKSAGINVNGTITSYINSDKKQVLSYVAKAPSNGTAFVGFLSNDKDKQVISKIYGFIVINLTKVFGEEIPSSDILDKFFLNTEPPVSGTLTVDEVLKKQEKLMIDIKTNDAKKSENIFNHLSVDQQISPILWAVKTDNSRRGKIPRPIGYLYYVPVAPFPIFYSSGSDDKLEFLCNWSVEATWNKGSSPQRYRAHITKDGDIICVWRGDALGYASDIPNVRQNPIIYSHNDYNNPKEVSLTGDKPTGWLQNCGVDYIDETDTFIFAEYTRPSHKKCNIWTVTKPFDDPKNWNITQSFELSGSNIEGMKHLHTINYDTYSGFVYSSTGDDNEASKILESRDNGKTWKIVLEGQRKYARVLNFIFLKNEVYWANDDYEHGFYRVKRNLHGSPDFTNIETIYDFTGQPPTYANIYYENPHGILILNRNDGVTDKPLNVYFYSLDEKEMHIVDVVNPVREAEFGFRLESAQLYPSITNDHSIIGFGNPTNEIDILDNLGDKDNHYKNINNVKISISKTIDGYKASYKTNLI